MNEVWRIALDHHLYIILPLFVGVWVWSNWAGWNERFESMAFGACVAANTQHGS